MNKILYTGPTCRIGRWDFTKDKLYDIHPYYFLVKLPSSKKIELSSEVSFILSDNNLEYYINTQRLSKFDITHYKPVKILDESTNNNFILIELEQWREKQIKQLLNG